MDEGIAAVIKYLEQRPEIDHVMVKDKPPCFIDIIQRWEEKNSCHLPNDLKQFYLMSDGMEIKWLVKAENSAPVFIGKMFINGIIDLNRIGFSKNAKGITLDDLNDFSVNDVTHYPLFNTEENRIFELDPCDGNGRVSLVINADSSKSSIWFLDRSLKFHHLADTFTEYYRLLLLHCGLPFWHYNYTDFGIPPYILHWYYMLVPALFTNSNNNSNENDQTTKSSSLIEFDPEKVFQRKNAVKNTKIASSVQPQQNYPQQLPGVRSATQNRTRNTKLTKSTNRSSSVPRGNERNQ